LFFLPIGGLILGFLIGIILDRAIMAKRRETYRVTVESRLDKMTAFYFLLVKWLRLSQRGNKIAQYFVDQGYRTVAIYGMKELGVRLFEELRDNGVDVLYGIDKDADNSYVPLDIYKPDESLIKVDVVVVTAVAYFDEIKQQLEKKIDYPIVSLEEVIDKLFGNGT